MKKILLIVAAILITFHTGALITYSQSFELINPASVPDTLRGLPQDGDLSSSPELKNISANPVNYKIALAPINLVNGHTFGLCDCFSCYAPEPKYYETTNPCNLEPGATSEFFVHIYLYPSNTEGVSVLNIRFFNPDNPTTDYISYQAVFIVGTTDVNETMEYSFDNSDIAPNPASNNVIVSKLSPNSSSHKTLEIYHSDGILMESFTLGNMDDSFEFKTTDYAQGVYFYRIISGCKTEKTGKFIISR